jgi:GTPase
VTGADLLLHVVDGSDALPAEQIKAVREVITDVIKESGTPAPPELLVVNKTDAMGPTELTNLRALLPDASFVSAHTGRGIDTLRERLAEMLGGLDVEISVLLPYTRGDLLARIHADGRIFDSQHEEGGTRVHARVPHALAAALSEYAHAGTGESGE